MKRKIAEIINVLFGFRKFFLMIFVMSVALIFRVHNLINGSEMVDLIKQVAIAFMGANGVEQIVTAVQSHMAAKIAATSGPADTDEANDEEQTSGPEDVK